MKSTSKTLWLIMTLIAIVLILSIWSFEKGEAIGAIIAK